MTWYGSDEDPFSLVGKARLLVARHNSSYGWNGKKDNCTQILFVEGFALGFACPEKSKSRYGHSPCVSWIKEEVENCEHKINHLFKKKKNGLYELIGDVYCWSSQSYEGEWDGDSELRNTSIQEICFDHAMYFDRSGDGNRLNDEIIQLIPRKEHETNFNPEVDIHYYMEKKQILVNQANALTRLIDTSSYYARPSYKDMKEEELENLIHMLMLQIDSEKQDKAPLALEIDQKVKDCLMDNEKLMIGDDYESAVD